MKAPIGGFVKNCLVKEGDYVTIGQPLMAVTQMRRLVLKADVSERYYAQLPRIVSANFKTPYNNKVYSLENLGGKVLSFGKSSGDTSYYVPVTFEFDNRGDMVPGAFVEVFLLSGERQGVISLPESALTEEQGLYFVYLKETRGTIRNFQRRTGRNSFRSERRRYRGDPWCHSCETGGRFQCHSGSFTQPLKVTRYAE